MNLPEQFILNMKKLLGDEFDKYEKSFEEKRICGLRVNTLKISPESFIEKNIFSLESVNWCKEGFYYKEEERPSKHPYYSAGLYYLQEPSAMSPASVLRPQEGEKVLDLCAAPGGKTTQLGAQLGNKGVLVANDISAGRTKALLKNVEIFGITNCIITSESPEKLSKAFEGYFHKILVDAPCSGEGMFRKEPDVAKSWNEEMIDFCQNSQRDILDSSAKMLKGGGQLLYSTCTFSPEENEKTINEFLDRNKDFYLISISEEFGFDDGNPLWVNKGREELRYTKRLWPHKIKGEGHFLALLQKNCEKEQEHVFEEEKTDSRIQYFQDFKNKFLDIELEGVFQIINDNLYLLPKEIPLLKGLRVLRSGWLLGEIKNNRFEPSQALAMGLKKEQVKNFADFPLNDQRCIRYLKGETVEAENLSDGWCLVLYDGYPLGWAKAQKGRLKNKYATGWIWK